MNAFEHQQKTVSFTEHTGTVISDTRTSETHIKSSGGGGYLHQGSGYTSSPQVTSTVVNKQEFWVRSDDGTDVSVHLHNDEIIPITEGQWVTLIYANADGLKEPALVQIINHNAKQNWVWPRRIGAVTKRLMPKPRLQSLAILAGLIIGAILWPFISFGAAGYGSYLAIARFRRGRAARQQLEDHLTTTAKGAYRLDLVRTKALPA